MSRIVDPSIFYEKHCQIPFRSQFWKIASFCLSRNGTPLMCSEEKSCCSGPLFLGTPLTVRYWRMVYKREYTIFFRSSLTMFRCDTSLYFNGSLLLLDLGIGASIQGQAWQTGTHHYYQYLMLFIQEEKDLIIMHQCGCNICILPLTQQLHACLTGNKLQHTAKREHRPL